jgi:hypothetical protein
MGYKEGGVFHCLKIPVILYVLPLAIIIGVSLFFPDQAPEEGPWRYVYSLIKNIPLIRFLSNSTKFPFAFSLSYMGGFFLAWICACVVYVINIGNLELKRRVDLLDKKARRAGIFCVFISGASLLVDKVGFYGVLWICKLILINRLALALVSSGLFLTNFILSVGIFLIFESYFRRRW